MADRLHLPLAPEAVESQEVVCCQSLPFKIHLPIFEPANLQTKPES